MFYRTLLATPRTCPIPILLLDTGGILMEHRIALKKLQFYHHIKHLDEDSLASIIAEIQEDYGYPGLMQECKNLLKTYNIFDDVRYVSKNSWKKLVKNCVIKKNNADLLEMAKKYKKLNHETLKQEEAGLKQYLRTLNLPDARLRFALRSKMTRYVQMNFKGHPAYKANGWKCNHCNVPDTQEHILECEKYQSLRENVNLDSDKGLVDYFRKVIDARQTLIV